MTPLELLDCLAVPIPPPRRHRYDGVPTPNAPLRRAVTELAAPVAALPAQDTPTCSPAGGGSGRRGRIGLRRAANARPARLDSDLGTCRAGVSRMSSIRLGDSRSCDTRIHKLQCLRERLESTAPWSIAVACENSSTCPPALNIRLAIVFLETAARVAEGQRCRDPVGVTDWSSCSRAGGGSGRRGGPGIRKPARGGLSGQ